MSKYRKIDPRIWNDDKFRSFSDRGKLVFIFLLTHPHMTSIGGIRATIPGLAAELGWEAEAFREAFREAFDKGMVKADKTAPLLWCPNFLKYNKPESPNCVISWKTGLDELPECQLKSYIIQQVKAFTLALPEAFKKALPEAFREAFAKASPIQEQEQEQKQEKEQEKINQSNSPAQKQSGQHRLDIGLLVKAIHRMARKSRVFQEDLAMGNGDLYKKMSDWTGKCSGPPWVMWSFGRVWERVRSADDGLNDPFFINKIDKPMAYLYRCTFPREFKDAAGNEDQPSFESPSGAIFEERRNCEWWWRTFFEKEIEKAEVHADR